MPTDAAPSPGSRPSRTERAARLAGCLDRARAGDLSALDDVVRDLNPLLWHVARSQGLSASDTIDVVQATWLALVSQLPKIRTAAALTSWLVTVTKREAWRTNRQIRRAVPTEELPESPAAHPGLDARLLTAERDQRLWIHFDMLSARCQQLLRVVAQVDRPDYSRVSEALGMPHGSIGPTRGRCLAKLRALLLADPVWDSG
ncbi:MAG: sigma-70 family RNA polymerase sigma factor [Lapillicoccus sp.]